MLKHGVNLTAYPASSWHLVAHLRGPIALDLSAVSDGNQHLFNITTENTKMGSGVLKIMQPNLKRTAVRVHVPDMSEQDNETVI